MFVARCRLAKDPPGTNTTITLVRPLEIKSLEDWLTSTKPEVKAKTPIKLYYSQCKWHRLGVGFYELTEEKSVLVRPRLPKRSRAPEFVVSPAAAATNPGLQPAVDAAASDIAADPEDNDDNDSSSSQDLEALLEEIMDMAADEGDGDFGVDIVDIGDPEIESELAPMPPVVVEPPDEAVKLSLDALDIRASEVVDIRKTIQTSARNLLLEVQAAWREAAKTADKPVTNGMISLVEEGDRVLFFYWTQSDLSRGSALRLDERHKVISLMHAIDKSIEIH